MANTDNYPLIESVDRLEEINHHSIILYDNPKYGSIIKKRFIENGLQKGEHTICFTPDNVDLLEKEITSSGIDVDHYKRNNLLHFYHIKDISKKPDEIATGYNDILKQVTADSKPPFRFVGKTISDVSTKDGILAELEVERIFHSSFNNYQCSFLCPYDISTIEQKQRSQWIRQLFSYHHNLIYATEPEKAVTFDTDLLTLEDV
jgi:hypothetical protein